VVKDLKGHLAKGERKGQSPGWLLLLASHMVILIIGIALGHWMGGRLAHVPSREMVPSGQIESGESEASEPIPGGESTVAKDEKTDMSEEVGESSEDQGREPEFTFYESLRRESQPAEETPKQGAKQDGSEPSQDTDPASRGVESGEKERSQPGRGTVYYVQVASFRDMERAKKLAGELKGKGYPSQVVSAVVPGKGIWHRVLIGPYEDKREAREVAAVVAAKEKLQPIITEKQEAPF
jgi:cell division septation protein DedD